MKLLIILLTVIMLIGTASALGMPKNNSQHPVPTPAFTYAQSMAATNENVQAVPQESDSGAVAAAILAAGGGYFVGRKVGQKK